MLTCMPSLLITDSITKLSSASYDFIFFVRSGGCFWNNNCFIIVETINSYDHEKFKFMCTFILIT